MARKYFAYLLRLWCSDDSQNPAWRISLEDPHSNQVTGFTDLEALFVYLSNLIRTGEDVEAAMGPGASSKTPPSAEKENM